MRQKSFLDGFHPEVWALRFFDQRLKLLQGLENQHARLGPRPAYRVEPIAVSDSGHCGEVDHIQKKILINDEHIYKDAMVCMAVHTVLHEGRHAYQQAAQQNEHLHKDKAQVELWRVNSENYIPCSEKARFVYRFQPLERDAEDYATLETGKIFESLEREYGQIKLYRKFHIAMELEKVFVAERARQMIGPNFEAEIDQALLRVHQKEHPAGQKKVYRISVTFEGLGVRSKTVAVDPAINGEDLKAHLAKLGRDYVLTESCRLKIQPEAARTSLHVEQLDQDRAIAHLKEMQKGRGHAIER